MKSHVTNPKNILIVLLTFSSILFTLFLSIKQSKPSKASHSTQFFWHDRKLNFNDLKCQLSINCFLLSLHPILSNILSIMIWPSTWMMFAGFVSALLGIDIDGYAIKLLNCLDVSLKLVPKLHIHSHEKKSTKAGIENSVICGKLRNFCWRSKPCQDSWR